MSTGWLTVEGWFKLMNTIDWKRKITRKNFELSISHYLMLSLSSLELSSELWTLELSSALWTMPDEESWGSIYRRASDLRFSSFLKIFEICHMYKQLEPWWIISAEKGKKTLLLSDYFGREIILFLFPCSTLPLRIKCETKPTIQHYSHYSTLFTFFFFFF